MCIIAAEINIPQWTLRDKLGKLRYAFKYFIVTRFHYIASKNITTNSNVMTQFYPILVFNVQNEFETWWLLNISRIMRSINTKAQLHDFY